MISISFSFVSLLMSSINLFCLQRVGRFADVNPSWKLRFLVALPMLWLLSGPLFSLVILTAYFRWLVFVHVFCVIGISFLVLKKCPKLRNKLYPEISMTHGNYSNHEKEYFIDNEHRDMGESDSDSLFYTAIFTSWLSPCTIWARSLICESYFLLVSSLTTIIGHGVGLMIIYVLLLNSDLSDYANPPITHCFPTLKSFSR